MSKPRNDIMVKGRSFGIFLLTVVQLVNGVVHAFFGLIMVSGNYSASAFSVSPMIYSVYTLVYGFFNLVIAYLIWEEKRSGWVGAILLSLFVICMDFLVVLNLLNFLGIPAFSMAVFGEIFYSSFVVFYLLQSHVRLKYNI